MLLMMMLMEVLLLMLMMMRDHSRRGAVVGAEPGRIHYRERGHLVGVHRAGGGAAPLAVPPAAAAARAGRRGRRLRRGDHGGAGGGDGGNGLGDGGEVGAGAALEVLGRRPRRVRGGEDGLAEGAPELHGLGQPRVGVVDEHGLQVRPVPRALPLDGLRPYHHQPLVALVHRLGRQLVRRGRHRDRLRLRRRRRRLRGVRGGRHSTRDGVSSEPPVPRFSHSRLTRAKGKDTQKISGRSRVGRVLEERGSWHFSFAREGKWKQGADLQTRQEERERGALVKEGEGEGEEGEEGRERK
ncbi:hypothetical protein EUGRSUZ_D01981 [Eucalyptus grandis]|uniref:Uncharacterized protein n=2 Tax=Eucalyptus grandis TaxID=71139 RepID=A0ACC3L714_EUCGR|nr:hypothetical protein EUGRSUZ_D01981 [Eucalyptus grandis]